MSYPRGTIEMTHGHSPHRNLWMLTVLCLLREGPMHPYELQRLIRQRHKDAFLDLKRGSLYHAIERLQRAGLIEVVETNREGRRPERTIYRLTETGEREVLDWLRELLAEPVCEPSQFVAALSFLPHLGTDEAIDQLEMRSHRLELAIVGINAILDRMIPQIGRAVLVEVEYVRALRQAERDWVRSVIDDIRAGRLTWDNKAAGSCARKPPAEDGSD
jgi:DNA-binding PadR family transcriptional regulator